MRNSVKVLRKERLAEKNAQGKEKIQEQKDAITALDGEISTM